MSDLTSLERTALAAIIAEQSENQSSLAKHVANAKSLSRRNTGGGFYTDLTIASDDLVSTHKFAAFGREVWISVDGLEFGLGMILHVRDGRASFLEGYAVGPEDTSNIDFENVRFALTSKPQHFLANDG